MERPLSVLRSRDSVTSFYKIYGTMYGSYGVSNMKCLWGKLCDNGEPRRLENGDWVWEILVLPEAGILPHWPGIASAAPPCQRSWERRRVSRQKLTGSTALLFCSKMKSCGTLAGHLLGPARCLTLSILASWPKTTAETGGRRGGCVYAFCCFGLAGMIGQR